MKNIKKIILALALTGFWLAPAMAQQTRPNQRPAVRDGQPARPAQPGERMEKLESAKIAFLSQKMDLNPKEAEKFWPVYNQFRNEVQELAKQRMADRKAGDAVSADNRLDAQLENETQMLEVKKKYTREFGRVIPAEKVVRLFEAEKEFRQELVKRLQERKKGQRE